MNLTMNSTIIELSVYAWNFVLKVLNREEPWARVWPKLMLKLQPKIAIWFILMLISWVPKKSTKHSTNLSQQSLDQKKKKTSTIRIICLLELIVYIQLVMYMCTRLSILGDPGAVNRDDTMFVVKVYSRGWRLSRNAQFTGFHYLPIPSKIFANSCI